jgi:hypothetical protein
LIYGIKFYGLNYENRIPPLHRLQKRALRIVLGLKFGESLRGHYGALNILPVPLLFQYSICLFIYKCSNGYLINGQPLNFSLSNTRGTSQKLIILNSCGSDKGRFTMGVLGAKYWNDLPIDIRSLKCRLNSFKRALKIHFMRDYN